MELPPFAEQVVEQLRGGDYDRLRRYHEKSPRVRVAGDYLPSLAAGPPGMAPRLAAPATERMAWLYLLSIFDHAMAMLRHPAHRLPSNVIYWDELEQRQTGAFRPPPATPMEAWQRMVARTRAEDTTEHGMQAGFVRLARKHYLLVILYQELHTIELPANPVDALFIWMGAVDPVLYPLERLPEEFRPFVATLRAR